MRINYNFRNSSIDAFLTEYADKKFTHLARLAPNNATLEVEFCDALGAKKGKTQVILNYTYPGLKDHVVVGVSEVNYEKAIDAAKEILEQKLRRIHEKQIDRSSSGPDKTQIM